MFKYEQALGQVLNMNNALNIYTNSDNKDDSIETSSRRQRLKEKLANHYKIQIIMLEPKQNSLFVILNVNNIQNHVTLNSNKESLIETAPNKLKCIIVIQGSYTQA